jgi:hypothetical protein
VLRHGTALGLWQLAVAATSTAPENAIHYAAEDARSQVAGPATPPGAEEFATRRRLLLVAEALDEEVAWHSFGRFQVAANIARDMLSGANAIANERLLYEQRREWDEIRLDLRGGGAARARYQRGAIGYEPDWSGRGGSAARRAERKVELRDFEEWLINRCEPDPVERHVNPPGWLVRVPSTWHAHSPSAALTGMREPYATWMADGRVLGFPVGPKQVVWPLVRSPGRPGWAPVPGIEPVLAAAAGLRPDQVTGFIEAVLVDWSAQHEDSEFRLRLPVDKAFGFGFIDADERRDAMARARATTLQAMSSIIDELPDHKRHHRAKLERAWGNDRLFGRVADRLGMKFRVAKATWDWPGRSVVDAIFAGTRTDAVQWLARWAHKSCTRMVQQSMEQAWHDAFDHRPAVYWLPTPPAVYWLPTPPVTPTNTYFAALSFQMDPDPPF